MIIFIGFRDDSKIFSRLPRLKQVAIIIKACGYAYKESYIEWNHIAVWSFRKILNSLTSSAWAVNHVRLDFVFTVRFSLTLT